MGSCFYYRKHSITALGFGVTRIPITFQEGRPGLTIKRLNCQPTGTHPSPRSASVWRSASRSSSLLSTRRPLLYIHWLQTRSIAPRHWVVTRGRSWLAPRPLYKVTVTREVSMFAAVGPKQELVSLRTTKMNANHATRWLDLVLILVRTRVETLETKTSNPWGISWFSKNELTWALLN